MKGCGISAWWALAIVSCAALLTGCGGGGIYGGGGGGGNQAPTITSFSAGAATIDAGSSTSLTAVFSNGTGVITPGNLPITSGGSVTVSPTATTTYTLVVTGSTGSPATSTTTVTVNPKITSFAASPAEIETGSSASLTAVFGGGAGVVTPGNITVTSGTAVTVKPASTTTYTLTVTGSSGTTPATQTATVTVDPVPTLTANPTSISSGSSAELTAVFTGTGVITTSGGFSQNVKSGVPISVSPTTTTTYTLTVTPPVSCVGCATKTASVTVTVNTINLISSFSANPSFIASGKTSSLIPVFSGGTGVITAPGGYSQNVTSSGSFPVSPTATTTYTLTVTPTGGGTPSTATVTVTVYAITSFSASPDTITAGSSTQLTAVFANGTGVITGPGGFSTNVTSGAPVSVTPIPPVTTTYTLTVTPSQGSGTPLTQTTTVKVNPLVTVDQGTLGAVVTDQILGMNLAAWYDDVANASSINGVFGQAGIKAIRWPGGSWSDAYHWGQGGVQPAMCPGATNGSTWAGYSTFDQFLSAIPQAGQFDLALTANYGSNAACNAGGDPAEAAAWAAKAVTDGYPASHITVGNENYGNWEYDLHTVKHDPTTYASAVSGASGYYSSIKTAVENAGGTANTTQVGVVVDANCTTSSGCTSGWDTTVLANAKGYYDFVEYHYYPQYGDVTSDTYLVQQAALDLTKNIDKIKAELSTAGAANTPIYVGELSSNSSDPGTQGWSITQGLYAGQILGEAMNDGISRLTWWIGFGNCLGAGNNAASLYGWQNTWGAYNVFSDADPKCPGEGVIGTMSPTAQAFNLFQNVAVNGEHVYTATVNGDTTNIRAYAATHSGGTALVLFNLNQTAAEDVVVDLSGQTNSSSVQVMTYDKEMYDYTNTACALDPTCTYDPNHDYSTAQWVSPTTTTLSGTQTFPLTLTLQPWSINVVLVK